MGVGFCIFVYILAWMIRPSNPYKEKSAIYECGEETVGPTWIQYNFRYYTFALIFVVFDIETIFLYPWALVYRKLGLFAGIEMLIFIGILVVGLIYAWKKGALEWL
jgi:NADH-quinone oxidoreductase subunit A